MRANRSWVKQFAELQVELQLIKEILKTSCQDNNCEFVNACVDVANSCPIFKIKNVIGVGMEDRGEKPIQRFSRARFEDALGKEKYGLMKDRLVNSGIETEKVDSWRTGLVKVTTCQLAKKRDSGFEPFTLG